jgi:hypothetical protein
VRAQSLASENLRIGFFFPQDSGWQAAKLRKNKFGTAFAFPATLPPEILESTGRSIQPSD